jgi:hypothetical protein
MNKANWKDRLVEAGGKLYEIIDVKVHLRMFVVRELGRNFKFLMSFDEVVI